MAQPAPAAAVATATAGLFGQRYEVRLTLIGNIDAVDWCKITEQYLTILFRPPTLQVGSIQAIKRDAVGSRDSQWARRNGLIPGIVYGYDSKGHGQVQTVYVKEASIRKEINKRRSTFLNTLFDM